MMQKQSTIRKTVMKMTNKRFPVPDHTLGILIFVAWVSLFFADTVAKKIEEFVDSDPWFYVELEVDGNTIYYFRDIQKWLHGHWTAIVQGRDDTWPTGWASICDATGEFTYRPETSGTISMSYEYFFDDECCVKPGMLLRPTVDS